MPPLQLVTVAGALSLVSGVIALAVSYTSYEFHQRVPQVSPLVYLSFGFLLLGAGLIVQGALSLALGFGVGNIVEDARLVYLMNVMYLVLENLAYLVFVVGYTRAAYAAPAVELALVATPREIGKYLLLRHLVFDVSQLVSVVLLVIVIFEGFLVASSRGSSFSVLVLASFVLLLAAHILMLYASIILEPFYFIMGMIVQFLSFASLLAFMLRGARVG